MPCISNRWEVCSELVTAVWEAGGVNPAGAVTRCGTLKKQLPQGWGDRRDEVVPPGSQKGKPAQVSCSDLRVGMAWGLWDAGTSRIVFSCSGSS